MTGGWNVAVKVMGIALLCILPASPAAGKPPFMLSKQTTDITEPLRPDGSVDYVAAVNQRFDQSVTPQNNGFVLWLRVMGLRAVSQSIRQQMLAMCGAEGLKDTDPGWTAYTRDTPIELGARRLWKAEEDPAFAAFLKSREDLLAIATQAAAKPRWWAPSVSTNGALTWVLLPELNPLRSVSWALCNRALLRAQQGDFDGFLADVMTMKWLGRRASGWTVIGHLVATGIDVLADQAIGAAVGAGVFSSDQCAKLAKDLDGMEPMPPLWDAVDRGERWEMLDWTESIATGKLGLLANGNAGYDQSTKPFKAVDRDSVDWNAVLQQINGDNDEIIEIMKTPSVMDEQIPRLMFNQKFAQIRANQQAQARLAKEPGEASQAYTQRVTDAIRAVLLPSLWRAEDNYRSGVMQGEMARAVVAAAQYRADKGKWPDRLEDLTPAYLPEAPREIFSTDETELVRYQKTDAGICLHARGVTRPDGSRQDIAVGVEQETDADGL